MFLLGIPFRTHTTPAIDRHGARTIPKPQAPRIWAFCRSVLPACQTAGNFGGQARLPNGRQIRRAGRTDSRILEFPPHERSLGQGNRENEISATDGTRVPSYKSHVQYGIRLLSPWCRPSCRVKCHSLVKPPLRFHLTGSNGLHTLWSAE